MHSCAFLIYWLQCSAGSQKSLEHSRSLYPIMKKCILFLLTAAVIIICLCDYLRTLLKENIHTQINFSCKGSVHFRKKEWSTFRATQFSLLANNLPIIFRLIACFYQGERLDQRSCEALEVILKPLHFDFINLQAAQLEENVSFMSKRYFTHLHLPVPIQFHIQACLCIRLEAIFFLPKELHNIPVKFGASLSFFIFFFFLMIFSLPGSIVLAGYDFVLWIYNPSWHFWQQQHGNIMLEGPRSFDKAGWQTQWNSNLFL